MKRIYTITKLVMIMIIAAFFTTGCSKSKAGSEANDVIKDRPVYALDSTSLGTISISEVAGGEASVSIHLNTARLAAFRPPFKPILENSEPMAYLNHIDPVTGISETSPVISTNNNLTVSYDLIMFTRDLKLRIEDGDGQLVAVAKLR
jgi:hypothetical protein